MFGASKSVGNDLLWFGLQQHIDSSDGDDLSFSNTSFDFTSKIDLIAFFLYQQYRSEARKSCTMTEHTQGPEDQHIVIGRSIGEMIDDVFTGASRHVDHDLLVGSST